MTVIFSNLSPISRLVAVLALMLVLIQGATMAVRASGSVVLGDLEISGAFIRATLPRAPVGSAYLTIVNHGTSDDRLVSVTAPVGHEVQIHEMTVSDGVMTMRELSEGLPVPQGETVRLEPGGKHLMIMGLAGPLEKGQSLELTLHFESAGEVVIRFDILSMNARGPDAARN
jgi:hypothetical protein